jgi:hypothetical protein
VCRELEFLGLALDADRNAGATGVDADIAADAVPVRVLRVGAREDLEIVAEVRRVAGLARSAAPGAGSGDRPPRDGGDGPSPGQRATSCLAEAPER